MSNYVSYFLTPSLAISAAIIVAVAAVVTLVFGRLLGTGRRAAFFLMLLALGAIVHFTLLREPPGDPCLDCFGSWGVDRLASGKLGTEVVLNIALFVPFGFLATWLWRAPFRVTGVAALLALGIEITQPLLGVGVNDVTDLAANTFGAYVGAGVATALRLVWDSIADRRFYGRRLVRFVAVAAISAGLALGLPAWRTSAVQASAADQFQTMFAGTDLADYERQQDAWATELHAFWEASGLPTNDGFVGDDVVLRRFTWNYYLSTRWVVARWDRDGFTTILASGADCTRKLL